MLPNEMFLKLREKKKTYILVISVVTITFIISSIWNVFFLKPKYKGTAILTIPMIPADYTENFAYAVGNLCNANDVLNVLQSNEFLSGVADKSGLSVNELRKSVKIYIIGNKYYTVSSSVTREQNLIKIEFISSNPNSEKSFFDTFLKEAQALKWETMCENRKKLILSQIRNIESQLKEISPYLKETREELKTAGKDDKFTALNAYSGMLTLQDYLKDKENKLRFELQSIYGFEYVKGPDIPSEPIPVNKVSNIVYATGTAFVFSVLAVLLKELLK